MFLYTYSKPDWEFGLLMLYRAFAYVLKVFHKVWGFGQFGDPPGTQVVQFGVEKP